MRHLAIGDIHGCYTALMTLAAAVPFSPEDVLVTLGDYVDRGPDTRRVIDWMIDYESRHPGRLITLRGNHELMMSNARKGGVSYATWLQKGGAETLASYDLSPESEVSALARIPQAHWQFLDETVRPFHETDTHFFVHANAYPDCPLEKQPAYMLYWERFEAAAPHQSGKVMVCGHTSQCSGLPVNYGYAVCIDTRAYGGNWLTCLDVTSGRYWQANQFGEMRTGHLEELPVHRKRST